MNTMLSVKEMQRAYLKKDASYDGIFFLGVRTTGIFCRPSCPARKPLPENVDYFSNVREAVFAFADTGPAGAAARWIPMGGRRTGWATLWRSSMARRKG